MKILSCWRSLFTNILIVICLFVFVFFYFIQKTNYDTPVDVFPKVNDYEELQCKFPNMDPWDSTILQYIKHPPPLKCNEMQPYLTFVGMEGVLRLNETELKRIEVGGFYTNITCFYQTFDRAERDSSAQFDQKIQLHNESLLSKSMVEVKCSAINKSSGKEGDFYYNLHAHPTLPESDKFLEPTENQLSVLWMSIDSMSLSMMKRNMPQTYDYVTKEMGMIVFEKFNKVADNTLPNMVAALMGKRIFDEQNDLKSEFSSRELSKKSDHFPLIWKEFAEKGYATMYNEDRPDIGIFGISTLKDFARKPTDYYYTPYWKTLQKDFTNRNLSFFQTFCFRNVPNGDLFVDLTKRHVMALNNYLQFMFNFFVYYSHEGDGIMIENADNVFKSFWRELFEGGYFNKTVIVFMGDHGQRFSNIRNTLVGLLEERNPFFSMWFSDWFYKLHPHIKLNLLSNSKRLSTTFDIHTTLQDIANANYDGSQRKGRAMSLLYPIPASRTCVEAEVPRQYCLCFTQKTLNVSDNYLQPIAESLVATLNEMLNTSKQCLQIKLETISRAESVELNEKVRFGERKFDFNGKNKRTRNSTERVRFAIKTQPNDAIFEAIMVKNQSINKWTVDGSVQRLTAYRNSSHCVSDPILKKYCTCIGYSLDKQ